MSKQTEQDYELLKPSLEEVSRLKEENIKLQKLLRQCLPFLDYCTDSMNAEFNQEAQDLWNKVYEATK